MLRTKSLKLVKDLMPEQLEVLTKATIPGLPSECIYVQGVAGSGKTTIALHIVKNLGRDNQHRPKDQKLTIVFLTYNRRLTEYCGNTLKGVPEIVEIMAEDGELETGCINVMTIQDFFRLALSEEDLERTVEDEECISKIGEISENRGIHELLPSQIFALISTFLRGKPELVDLSIDDLDSKIREEYCRSTHYQMYGDSLLNIRKRLLGTYEDWKDDRLDRSSVAFQFRRLLNEAEKKLIKLETLDTTSVRTASRIKLGDQDSHLFELMQWLQGVIKNYQSLDAIESSACRFYELFNDKHMSKGDLDALIGSIHNWIPKFGLRSEPLWDKVIKNLDNPVIIVDEVQDLSEIECENLISLWFQLPRNQTSRLMLLGDLNQQMTPSGFEWSNIIGLYKQKQNIFHDNHPSPDKPEELNNNYRTTVEIARAASSMVNQVAIKSFSPEISKRYLENSIDPELTLPINLQEKLLQLEEEDLIPKLIIGDKKTFEEALLQYLTKINQSKVNTESQDQILSTVIITEHASQLDALIEQEENQFVLDFIEVIPVLSCKGLEFDRCILYGLSIKENGDIEADLLSKWYTSFTRAKLQLLIYLNSEEIDYIQRSGWRDRPLDTLIEQKNLDIKDTINALMRIGTTEIDEEGHWRLGEINLAKFLGSRDESYNESYLEKSLRHFREGGWNDGYLNAAWEGAERFKKQGNFIKAADYYLLAESIVDHVNCLNMERKRMLDQDGDIKAADKLLDQSFEAIKYLGVDEREEIAKCWIILEDYVKALENVRKEDMDVKDDIAKEVLEKITLLIEEGENDNAIIYTNLLEEYAYFDEAANAWVMLEEWEKAFDRASKSSLKIKQFASEKAVDKADFYIKKKQKENASVIANLLDRYGYYTHASKIRLDLREFIEALKSQVKSGDMQSAEITLERTSLENKMEAYAILAEGYFSLGLAEWPKAYHYYFLAKNDLECKRIENRCRAEQRYVTLTQSYMAAGHPEKAREIANERQIQDNREEAEIAALCWEATKNWEHATKSWMDVYYRESDRFQELFGPNPNENNIRRASYKRFYDHIEQYANDYGLTSEDQEWVNRYISGEQQHLGKIAQIVEKISDSKKWQEQAGHFQKEFRKTIKISSLDPSGETYSLRLRPEREVSSDQIKKIWRAFMKDNNVFRGKASENAYKCFDENQLLGIHLLYKVCSKKDEAEKLAFRKLSRSRDPKRKELWIKSWEIFEWKYEKIDLAIGDLRPIQDADIIWQAINKYYRTGETRQKARLRYRRRLEGIRSKAAKNLFMKYFPDYTPAIEEEKIDSKSKQRASSIPLVFQLLERFVDQTDSGDIDEDIHEDLERHVERIKRNPDQLDKLPQRLSRLKNFISINQIKDRDKLIVQVDEIVESMTLGEIKLNELVTIGSNLDDGEGMDPKTEYPIGKIPDVGEAEVKEPIKQKRRRKKRRRKSRKTPETPGKLERIDLHGYNLDEAKSLLDDCLDLVLSDKSVRCLLVVHGYGKDKAPSVIKKEVQERLNRLSRHGRVYKVFPGEFLDGFDENSVMIKKLCPEFRFKEIGRNNPGISIVLFR